MTVYRLQSPDPPWGDYGDVLIHGLSAHIGRANGLLQLERTGPFVPPLTQPGIDDLIVTDALRRQLQATALTGFVFRPLIKRRIVRLNWEEWDWTAPDPPEYPASGESEDYVLQRPHDPELAHQIGDLWELVITATRRADPTAFENWTGDDFFRLEGTAYTLLSEHARAWLERAATRWVRFTPLPTPWPPYSSSSSNG
jgi:hypothetical protein